MKTQKAMVHFMFDNYLVKYEMLRRKAAGLKVKAACQRTKKYRRRPGAFFFCWLWLSLHKLGLVP